MLRVLIAFIMFLGLAESKSIKPYQIAYENLSRIEKDQFYEFLTEAKRLYSQKRIFETLYTLDLAEALIPEFPVIMSIKGACYVEFRDFKSAISIFERSLELSPKNYGVLFNIGEVYLIQGKWKKAEQYYRTILRDFPNLANNPTYLLAEFKSYIVDKKLKNTKRAKRLESKYDYRIDSPIVYYIEAVRLFEAGEDSEAQKEIEKVKRIFRSSALLSPWHDTLIECHYLYSLNGSTSPE